MSACQLNIEKKKLRWWFQVTFCDEKIAFNDLWYDSLPNHHWRREFHIEKIAFKPRGEEGVASFFFIFQVLFRLSLPVYLSRSIFFTTALSILVCCSRYYLRADRPVEFQTIHSWFEFSLNFILDRCTSASGIEVQLKIEASINAK